MQIHELYSRLSSAYSLGNLNNLSSGIISLYRSGDAGKLRRIHACMYNGDQGGDQLSRIFSRIIMVYHPDRQEQITKQLEGFYTSGDLDGMRKMDHILDVQMIDLTPVETDRNTDIDFDYEDIWDDSAGGYSFIDDDEVPERDEYDYMQDAIMNYDFLTAVKRKVYGYLNVDFPVHLLADMEIIEMAEYEIENLDGVEFCTYARIIDLAGNNLTEVTQLALLMRLEEVYLQNNQIGYLDGLNELPYLRVLDISFNDVDDISPLFELDTLEFLNIMGNRVPDWQLETLSKRGVIIVS